MTPFYLFTNAENSHACARLGAECDVCGKQGRRGGASKGDTTVCVCVILNYHWKLHCCSAKPLFMYIVHILAWWRLCIACL